MLNNTRAIAAHLIIQVLDHQQPLTKVLATFKKNCPKKMDAAFVQALAFGVLRWLPRLDFVLHKLLEKPLKAKDKDLQCLLYVGLFQLMFLQTAPYAAVAETVGACLALQKPWASKLVNAILRNYQREATRLQGFMESEATALYAHPSWLMQAIQKAWPAHWQSILEANNQAPPLVLRINIQQISRKDYLSRLEEENIEAFAIEQSTTGVHLKTPQNIETLPGFEAGYFSVQDAASQAIAGLLDLKPGLRVLDACAAPGGKTALLLETEPTLNMLALDNSNTRLQRMRHTMERLHLKATLLEADASKPNLWWDGVLFDRILLDAPCSATGVIRRHPDIKYLRTEDNCLAMVPVQKQLLEALWPLLKPEGILLYTTCSILPQENADLIQDFVAQNTEAIAMSLNLPLGLVQNFGHQVLPGQGNRDGFYYAALKKSSLTPDR
ncbi:MAG: 16S rRNA (cytosine(967)-C(5))-methyltransferase RsmB [Gammaproteobacteria bacterium]|nr:16S rRNA (cytosine(967)-C(5))-methyltransferase RsmB [Gammaproteobacteria bacterium]